MRTQLHPFALAFACACTFAAEGVGANTDTDTDDAGETLPTLSPTGPSSSTSSASSASSAGSGEATSSASSAGTTDDSEATTAIGNDESTSTGPGVEVPPDAIAFWAFEDDPDAGTVEDLTGNGHDGVLVDGATFEAGRFGQGVRIDEDAGHVRVEDSAELDLTDGYTIEAWARPLPGDLTLRDLLWKGELGSLAYGVRLGLGTTRPPIMASGPCSPTDTQPGLTPGDWHHIAVSWDGSTMRTYLDAVLRVEAACTDAMPVEAGGLYIGRASNGSGTWGLAGDVDHVAIFDHAREPSEICNDGGGTWADDACTY